jgi:hypothetical protein
LLSLKTVTEVISCAPGIVTLEIRRIHIVLAFAKNFTPPAPPSGLEDLILVPYEGCPLFFSWLRAIPIPPILRSLEISQFIEDAYDRHQNEHKEPLPLAAYFRQAGTGLQTLNINFLSRHRQFPRRNSIVSLISLLCSISRIRTTNLAIHAQPPISTIQSIPSIGPSRRPRAFTRIPGLGCD